MYTVFAFGVIAVVILILMAIAERWNVGGFVAGIFFAALIGILLGALVADGIGRAMPSDYTWVQVENQPLWAASDTDSYTGQWFLFSGTLDKQDKYAFWRLNANGSKSWDDTITKDLRVQVFEEDRKDGVLLTFDLQKTALPGGALEGWGDRPAQSTVKGEHRWEFHVPTGTIKQGFSFK